MSNSLLEKIKADAATEAAAITAAAEQKLEAHQVETEAMLTALTGAAAEKLEKEKSHLETVALSKARQAGSIAIQRAKREGVDEVFEAVFTELSEADEKAYIAYFTNLAKQVLPEEASGTVLAPKNRLPETEAIVKALHIDGKVHTVNTVIAGFILDSKEGAFDVTLERVFAEARPRLEVELLKRIA